MKIKFVKKLAVNSIAFIFSGVILCGATTALAQTSASAYTVIKTYDFNGQLTGMVTPDPDGGGPRTFAAVRNTYNLQGLLEKIETGTLASLPSSALKSSEWVGFSVTNLQNFTYDNWGRKLTASKKASGNSFVLTQYTYDNYGRLECEAVRMNPDVFNSLPASACVLSAAGTFGQDRIIKYNYDFKSRVTSVIKAYGTVSQQTYAAYTYNDFWEKENITDANGNLAKMVYDGFGRLKQWQFPSKTQVGSVNPLDYEGYTYDLNDNRLTLRKRDAQVITYTPDNLNRVITKDLPGSADDVSYNYDNRGLELSSTFIASNKGITTSYDGFGRITASTNSMFTVSKTLSYEYDDNGNRVKITHPDGVKFGYAYDGINLLTNVCENADPVVATAAIPLALRCADTSKEVISPDYDSTSNRKLLTLAGGGVTNYEYDSNNRLKSFAHNLSGSTYDVLTSFTYNPASQVTTRTINNDVFTYKGNQNFTGNYAVNGLNQYTGVGGKIFTYDNNSNLTSDGLTTFAYDTENHLITATGLKTATLKYDPKGRLFEVIGTINGVGVTTQFLYDGDALVAEYDASGNILNRYVHGSRVDEPYLWYPGSSVNASNRRNLYADYQGSVVAVTNNNAAVQGVNTYDAYGIPNVNNLGRFSYTGQTYLPEVGLHYYKARIYSPMLGRFLQTDPIGYEDQMNLYAYVHNDPMNYTDPTGEVAFLIPLAIIAGKAAIGAATSYGAARATGTSHDVASKQALVGAVVGAVTAPGVDLAVKAGANAVAATVAQGALASAVSQEVVKGDVTLTETAVAGVMAPIAAGVEAAALAVGAPALEANVVGSIVGAGGESLLGAYADIATSTDECTAPNDDDK